MQPLLQWKSNTCYIFWVCVYRLRYPVCKALVAYFHLWPAWLYNIIPHCLINGRISEKVIEHKMCFDCLYNFCLKHFSFLEELNEIWSKMCISLHLMYPLFLTEFNELEFYWKILEKYSNLIFHENPSTGSRVVPCGWTDVMKLSHFLQFCERTRKLELHNVGKTAVLLLYWIHFKIPMQIIYKSMIWGKLYIHVSLAVNLLSE